MKVRKIFTICKKNSDYLETLENMSKLVDFLISEIQTNKELKDKYNTLNSI